MDWGVVVDFRQLLAGKNNRQLRDKQKKIEEERMIKIKEKQKRLLRELISSQADRIARENCYHSQQLTYKEAEKGNKAKQRTQWTTSENCLKTRHTR